MALILPVVDSQDPQVDSSARGDADVQTGRIDDETDQKKLTGKELSKGKNKNFVPLVKSQTKKKAGEEPEADPEPHRQTAATKFIRLCSPAMKTERLVESGEY